MKKHLLIICGILLMAGCQKELEEAPPPQAQTSPRMTTRSVSDGDMIVLGQKLENPYSVTNMKAAQASLQASLAKARNFVPIDDPIICDRDFIKSTHLYIKLHPKTQEELDILKQDTTLILYEYPLDYEILEGGSYYHDPSIPDSLPTYQYAAIPFRLFKIQKIHDVEFEILESLFIPDEYKGDTDEVVIQGRAEPIQNTPVEMLVDASLDLCRDPDVDDRPTGGIPGEGTGGIGLDGKWNLRVRLCITAKSWGGSGFKV